MNNIRMLWEQHGAWTRMAITSMFFGIPDEDLVINRLLQNPVDTANTLKLFYGDKIASTLMAEGIIKQFPYQFTN